MAALEGTEKHGQGQTHSESYTQKEDSGATCKTGNHPLQKAVGLGTVDDVEDAVQNALLDVIGRSHLESDANKHAIPLFQTNKNLSLILLVEVSSARQRGQSSLD